VDEASRRAVDNLVQTAIDEGCRFLVISGDVFDGQWRDYRTGIFFADRMRKLGAAGIEVFITLGNHDAENRFAGRLDLEDEKGNVHLFPHRQAASLPVKGLDVMVHGRSYNQRDVTENLAKDYPPPAPGRFNIGLLHTACTGRPPHDPYAPCTVEQLVHHGYDYWALGHAHTLEVVNRDPYIVYPGNLQGRSSRETGPKGACLVTVVDDRVVSLEARVLDVIRWSVLSIDVTNCQHLTSVYTTAQEAMRQALNAADGRALALHLTFSGTTALHDDITRLGAELREEIETIAARVSDGIWIEHIEVATVPPSPAHGPDPTVAGRIRVAAEQFATDPAFTKTLEEKLAEVREKMPAAAHADELFAAIRRDGPTRALNLALSLIEIRQEQ
jgi:DNA repair exonuclease SbcCD nuclease subunit